MKDKNEGSVDGEGKRHSLNPEQDLIFYYNRDERLKKLHRTLETKHTGFFKSKRSRRLLVLFIDIVIIAVVIYIINRPTNVYEVKSIDNLKYELNISGVRGHRVMFAVTVSNTGSNKIDLSNKSSVVLKIVGKGSGGYNTSKKFQDATLGKNESTSVVFMIDEKKLPRYGEVSIYIDQDPSPIFKRKVRFYYYKM